MTNNTTALTSEQAASITWAIRAAKESGYTADAEVLKGLLASPRAAAQPPAVSDLPRFPVSLRKMWSGGDVQDWIDDNIKPLVQEHHFDAHCDPAAPRAPSVPAGWKLVPIEGTGDMHTAIFRNERDAKRAWKEALDAAPAAPVAESVAEPLCPNGEPWNPNPDGIKPGHESTPRMNHDTGMWEDVDGENEPADADDYPATPESERAAFNAMMRWHLIRLLQAWRYGGDLRAVAMAAFEWARTNDVGTQAFKASENAVKVAAVSPATAAERAAFDYDDVVSICDAHGIRLPVDCVEMVVEIVREYFAGRDHWDFKVLDRTLKHGEKLYRASAPADAGEAAQPTADLIARCRELLELSVHGESEQTALRALADTYRRDIHIVDRREMAKSHTHREAVKFVLAAARAQGGKGGEA